MKLDFTAKSWEMPMEPLKGAIILLAEDEPFSRMLMTKMLKSMGVAEVLTAHDGMQAMRMLQQRGDEIALLITDIDMPNMNGLQLLKAVRLGEAGAPASLPVLVTTSMADHQITGRCDALDAQAVLLKPASRAHVEQQAAAATASAFRAKDAEAYRKVSIAHIDFAFTNTDPAPTARAAF